MLVAGLPRASLVLAPVAAGCPRAPGLRLAPAAILGQLEAPPTGVHLPVPDGATPDEPLPAVQHMASILTRCVGDLVAAGHLPFVLGGDHSVAVGSALGVRDGLRQRSGRDVPLFVLWLDAHPDLNTPATSPTGNLHGMALAGLVGRGPLAAADPLPPQRVTLAGVRDADPGELAYLQSTPDLALWDIAALRGPGWRPLAENLLAHVAAAGGRLYVSLDLDVLDPLYAPGVAVPVPGGARPAPLFALLRRLRASGLVAGGDVVELYPPADRDGATARLAAQALAALGAVAPSRVQPATLAYAQPSA